MNMLTTKFKILFLVILFGTSLSLTAQPSKSQVNVIPLPEKVRTGQGSFAITEETPLLYIGSGGDAKHSALLFAESMKLFGGPELTVREMKPTDKNIPAVIFSIAKEGKLPAEGYC